MNELDPTLAIAIPLLVGGYALVIFGFWYARSPRSRERRDP